ncbi:hypothetical protein N7462_001382 [Penicillium macrosclerotiorum]|uniref:uncharacterized protein n=1 Tax=Penicillium macrosclerotiorum TaxID=303699 RepID=UPI0025494D2F|nr:uncharacterized protein N7462_001382 [Penicillium macrosclerotiorum]KAJ5691959.1 hypothetical protein N7462_001382 [Penicillium macrosclerotiorum]
MHFQMLRWTVSLAALSGTTTAMGMTAFHRDLKLAAQIGISPSQMLSERKSVQALAQQIELDNVTAKTVSKLRFLLTTEILRWAPIRIAIGLPTHTMSRGGPVFIYDVGEATAENAAKLYLGNSTTFLAEILEEFRGLGIVWEHRYYGDSLPFNVSEDTPPEHFKYLTNKQALADIPFFAQNFSLNGYEKVDLTPSGTPWVMVGGSYSGMRSAFTRDAYPDTIFASYASSAPVEARVNMSMYYDQVYAGMVANGHLNCTKDVKAALEYIDGELSKNNTAAAAIKQLFFGKGAEKNNNGDFTAALAGVFGFFQSYGLGGGDGSLGSFCEHLETDPETLRVAGPRGFAPYRGKKYVAERYASWPVFTSLINYNFNTNCKQLDNTLPLSCKLNPKSADPDTISWTWQFCTEWGYFQSNNFGPHSLQSRFQSLDYIQYTCNRQFPEAIKQGLLPKSPQVDATNQQTGGWTIRPSNVYWSGGQFDPWRTLSPLATEEIAPQGVTFTTDIPKCNVETDENTLFGYILANAEHCFDFQKNFGPGKISRGYFYEALKKWLPCFESRHDSPSRGQF